MSRLRPRKAFVRDHEVTQKLCDTILAALNQPQAKIAELTAECDRLRERCDFWQNFMEQVGPGAYCHAGCKEAEQRKRIAELTAERDRLRDQLTAIRQAAVSSAAPAGCARATLADS